MLWGVSLGSSLTSAFLVLVLSTTLLIYPILSQELRHGRIDYATLPALRETPTHIILVYRATEIYVKNLLIRIGSLILPVQAYLSQFVLILNYILIKHGRDMNAISIMVALAWSMACLIVWISMLSLASTFHKEATTMKRSWKGFQFATKLERKYMSKFAKSCKPLFIGKEGVFRISKKTVLKFLQGIVRGTFRALITLKWVCWKFLLLSLKLFI